MQGESAKAGKYMMRLRAGRRGAAACSVLPELCSGPEEGQDLRSGAGLFGGKAGDGGAGGDLVAHAPEHGMVKPIGFVVTLSERVTHE